MGCSAACWQKMWHNYWQRTGSHWHYNPQLPTSWQLAFKRWEILTANREMDTDTTTPHCRKMGHLGSLLMGHLDSKQGNGHPHCRKMGHLDSKQGNGHRPPLPKDGTSWQQTGTLQPPTAERWDILAACWQKMGHLDSKQVLTNRHTTTPHCRHLGSLLTKDGTHNFWQTDPPAERWDTHNYWHTTTPHCRKIDSKQTHNYWQTDTLQPPTADILTAKREMDTDKQTHYNRHPNAERWDILAACWQN